MIRQAKKRAVINTVSVASERDRLVNNVNAMPNDNISKLNAKNEKPSENTFDLVVDGFVLDSCRETERKADKIGKQFEAMLSEFLMFVENENTVGFSVDEKLEMLNALYMIDTKLLTCEQKMKCRYSDAIIELNLALQKVYASARLQSDGKMSNEAVKKRAQLCQQVNQLRAKNAFEAIFVRILYEEGHEVSTNLNVLSVLDQSMQCELNGGLVTKATTNVCVQQELNAQSALINGVTVTQATKSVGVQQELNAPVAWMNDQHPAESVLYSNLDKSHHHTLTQGEKQRLEQIADEIVIDESQLSYLAQMFTVSCENENDMELQCLYESLVLELGRIEYELIELEENHCELNESEYILCMRGKQSRIQQLREEIAEIEYKFVDDDCSIKCSMEKTEEIDERKEKLIEKQSKKSSEQIYLSEYVPGEMYVYDNAEAASAVCEFDEIVDAKEAADDAVCLYESLVLELGQIEYELEELIENHCGMSDSEYMLCIKTKNSKIYHLRVKIAETESQLTENDYEQNHIMSAEEIDDGKLIEKQSKNPSEQIYLPEYVLAENSVDKVVFDCEDEDNLSGADCLNEYMNAVDVTRIESKLVCWKSEHVCTNEGVTVNVFNSDVTGNDMRESSNCKGIFEHYRVRMETLCYAADEEMLNASNEWLRNLITRQNHGIHEAKRVLNCAIISGVKRGNSSMYLRVNAFFNANNSGDCCRCSCVRANAFFNAKYGELCCGCLGRVKFKVLNFIVMMNLSQSDRKDVETSNFGDMTNIKQLSIRSRAIVVSDCPNCKGIFEQYGMITNTNALLSRSFEHKYTNTNGQHRLYIVFTNRPLALAIPFYYSLWLATHDSTSPNSYCIIYMYVCVCCQGYASAIQACA